MNDPTPDCPPGALLFSVRLRALRSDCPLCGGWEEGTGWLLRGAADRRAYVELRCTSCGSRGRTWRAAWQPLIDELLAEAGAE